MKENPLPKAKFIFSYQKKSARIECSVWRSETISLKKHPHILISCAVCFASQGHILKLTHSY